MGTYVYVARKRPTNVRLADGSVVTAYPLTYTDRLSDFNRAFQLGGDDYREGRHKRMQVARSQRAFEDEKVEYVYVSPFDNSPVPLEGLDIYKIESLVSAEILAFDMQYESSCAGGPEIFWADCDSTGVCQGTLVPPTRVGRKLGPWTLAARTKDTEIAEVKAELREGSRRQEKETRRKEKYRQAQAQKYSNKVVDL